MLDTTTDAVLINNNHCLADKQNYDILINAGLIEDYNYHLSNTGVLLYLINTSGTRFMQVVQANIVEGESSPMYYVDMWVIGSLEPV